MNATNSARGPYEVSTLDAPLLTQERLSEILRCSRRHISRLVMAGEIPPPIHLGTLARWPKRVIDEWITAGCPPVKTLPTGSKRAEASRG